MYHVWVPVPVLLFHLCFLSFVSFFGVCRFGFVAFVVCSGPVCDVLLFRSVFFPSDGSNGAASYSSLTIVNRWRHIPNRYKQWFNT